MNRRSKIWLAKGRERMKSAAGVLIIAVFASLFSIEADAKTTRKQAEHVCLETAKQGASTDRNSVTPNGRQRAGFAHYSACMKSKGF